MVLFKVFFFFFGGDIYRMVMRIENSWKREVGADGVVMKPQPSLRAVWNVENTLMPIGFVFDLVLVFYGVNGCVVATNSFPLLVIILENAN
ncbi:unnamed protein product [Camellia sinensis]